MVGGFMGALNRRLVFGLWCALLACSGRTQQVSPDDTAAAKDGPTGGSRRPETNDGTDTENPNRDEPDFGPAFGPGADFGSDFPNDADFYDDGTDTPGCCFDDDPIGAGGPPNLDCPEYPPYTGAGAPRGPCCYRSAINGQRVARAPDAALQRATYRVNYEVVVNHPDSVGLPPLVALARSRNDYHEANLLFELQLPVRDGLAASGLGFLAIGFGAYDCKGVYRYYDDTVAPVQPGAFPGSDDPGRYAPNQRPVYVYARAGDVDHLEPQSLEPFHSRTYMPFLNADTFALEWEMITRDLTLLDLTFTDGSLDCVGFREGSDWVPGGRSLSYAVLADNHRADNGIPTLGMETLSQLLAFGLLGEADRQTLDPSVSEGRCAPQLDLSPDQRTCRWLKLPDSLCPSDGKEAELFGCHVGDPGNLDGLPTRCSMTAPTTPRLPEADDEGQCCDPLGQNGLPRCNAWALVSEFVAAGARIDDTWASQLQRKCN